MKIVVYPVQSPQLEELLLTSFQGSDEVVHIYSLFMCYGADYMLANIFHFQTINTSLEERES